MVTAAGASSHLLKFGLGCWVVGLFTVEALASVGTVAVCLAAGWIAWQRQEGPNRQTLITWWPLAAWFAGGLLFPLLGGNLPTATGFARHAEWWLIPVTAWSLGFVDSAARRRLVILIAAMSVLSALVAGFQHFGWWPPSEAFRPYAWTKIPFDRVYELAPGSTDRHLAGGLAFHRLKFAHVGAIAVGVLSAWAIGQRGAARWGLALSALATLIAITLFPGARAGFVAATAAAVAAVAASQKPTVKLVAVGGAVLVFFGLLAMAYTPVRTRLLSSLSRDGSGARSMILASGLKVIGEAPLTGIGLGRFRVMDHVPPDAPSYLHLQPGKAHNQFLSAAAEAGIPSAILFAIFVAQLVARLLRSRGTVGVAALGGFLVLAVIHDPLFHVQFAMAFIGALAAGFAPKKDPSPVWSP